MPRRHRGHRSRLAVLTIAAVGLGLGCRATSTDPGSKPPSHTKLDATAGIKADPGIIRAGFDPKVKPGQEVGVHMDMGRGHESQGQLEAAATDYQKALDSLEKPGHRGGSGRTPAADKATAHRKLAGVLDRLGRFGQSEMHYQAALKLAPDDPKVWNNAGYSYYVQGRWDVAERTLRTAVRLAPDDPRMATNLGLALVAHGKTDEAQAVLARTGGPAAAEANIAYVLASTGHRPEAANHYRKALALQPGLPVAEAALAQLDAAQRPAATLATIPPLPSDPSVGRASGPPRREGPSPGTPISRSALLDIR
jgi:Flp pilus assembly protein TadD